MRSLARFALAEKRPWLTAACEPVLRLMFAQPRRRKPAQFLKIPRRLLVVKVHGLGDSVLVRSMVEHLKRRHPKMEIGVLVGAGTVEVMTLNSDFRVHFYSQADLTIGSAVATLLEVRRGNYEAVLNFEQGSLTGTAFLAGTGIPVRLGFVDVHEVSKSRFLTHSVCFDENRSMWESFVSLARLVDPGLVPTTSVMPIRCSQATEMWLEQWWSSNVRERGKVVAFHTGCGRGMKFRRWPLERFVRLAEELRRRLGELRVVLTGTEAEVQLVRRFIGEYSGYSVDATSLGTMERTIGVLKRCELLVSNDTGIMHLGAAIGVPTVGLFGPNTPRHWAPIGPRATYVYETALSCSPCINNYRNQMPMACTNPIESQCMHDISVASVIRAVERVVPDGWLG